MLSVVGAFYFVSNSVYDKEKKIEKQKSFCLEHSLNFKLMNEIFLLGLQLAQILVKSDKELQEKFKNKHQLILTEQLANKPTKKQKVLLRQIITSGLIDNVARLEEASAKQGVSVTYLTSMSSEKVNIHPSSFLCTERHEYVVYKEIITTKRPYMKQLTSINASWLYELAPSLVNLSTPLSFPLPRYDSKTDQVKCWVDVTFGPNLWNLPKQEIIHPDSPEKVKLFCKFLVEGFVLPFLTKFQQHLVQKPSLITSQLNERDPLVMNIVRPLLRENICTLKSLQQKWSSQKDRLFLLAPLLAWFQPSVKSEITKLFMK